MGYVSKEDYKKQIDEIIDLLEGKVDKILKQLTEEMEEASKNMQYETAAYLRDKIIAIENVSKRQKVSNMGENDIDVIGFDYNMPVKAETTAMSEPYMIDYTLYFDSSTIEKCE